jgi:WD40 repeat protein
MLAGGDAIGRTYLWKVGTGKRIARLTDPGIVPGFLAEWSLAFRPSGTMLAVGAGKGRVYLWNVATGRLIATLADPGSHPASDMNTVAFSPNGTRLVSANGDGSIYLWKVGGRTARVIAMNVTHI